MRYGPGPTDDTLVMNGMRTSLKVSAMCVNAAVVVVVVLGDLTCFVDLSVSVFD